MTIKSIVLHPVYPGAVTVLGLNKMLQIDTCLESIDAYTYNYYQLRSPYPKIAAAAVMLNFTLPSDYKDWAELNAILISFRTESWSGCNSHINIYVRRSGVEDVIVACERYTNTEWSVIAIGRRMLTLNHTDFWKPGDTVELHLQLQSRNDYWARLGKIEFRYEAMET